MLLFELAEVPALVWSEGKTGSEIVECVIVC